MNPSASSSVRWKINELQSIIQEERGKQHSLPFLAVTETWLKSYMSDAQLHLPGYVVSRSDREIRTGGGVLLYSHQNLPVSECQRYDDRICEAVFCRFDTIKTCVAVIYRPPNASTSSFSALLDFVSSCIKGVSDDSYDFIVTGDFNLPVIDWETNAINCNGALDATQSGNILLTFNSEHFLNQYVMSPTRGSNVLDLFLTNNSRLVTNIECKTTSMSDHNMVDIMLAWNPLSEDKSKVPAFDENSFRSLDFSKANSATLKQKLNDVDWVMLQSLCTSEEFPVLFTDTLFQICQSCVPAKKIPTGRPKQLNALRRRKVRTRARLDALISSNGDATHIANVRTKLALICYDIKEAFNEQMDKKERNAVEKIKTNPKYFYSYAKSLSKVKSTVNMLFNENEQIVTDPKAMADVLQRQFSSVFSDPDSPDIQDPQFDSPEIIQPLQDSDFVIKDEDILSAISDIPSDSASGPDGIPVILLKSCASELCQPIRLIWAESFRSGIVPQFYKETHISPLYKKGDRAKAVNYRPIALTSHIIKIYERILRKTMVRFADNNEILCNNQHGFRSGRSCLTQLLSHFDDIFLGLSKGADTDAIYLDYAKAFDKVDHRLLLNKLQKYGFHPKLLQWIESFLSDRLQNVVLGGISSFAAAIISGVPQGSVLGPLLFILFINDMKLCVNSSIIRFFADDTRILKHIFCEEDVIALQQDLDAVIKWAKCNNMALHEDKFELLVHKYCPHNVIYELPFSCQLLTYQISNGDLLSPASYTKDLGVTVTSDLSWSRHVGIISSRATAAASWVLSAFKARDRNTMLTLFKSLVRSHLEYCCPLWNSNKVFDIQQLERVQRMFTSKIIGVGHLDYWERLKSLKIMSLQRRRERYIIIHMWKTLHNRCPNDLQIQFSVPSRHGIKALLPSLAKSSSQRNQSLYDSSFAVMGPRLWNIIPSQLHSVADPMQFKYKLTEFINRIPDKPPVSGYSCANRNSLLEWSTNMLAAKLEGRSAYPMTQ
jgi:hypothetical protein